MRTQRDGAAIALPAWLDEPVTAQESQRAEAILASWAPSSEPRAPSIDLEDHRDTQELELVVHHKRGVRAWLLVAAGAAAALGASSFFFQPAEVAVRECRLPVPTPDAVVEAVSAPMFIPEDPTPAPRLRRPRPVAEAAVQKLLDAGTALAAQGKHKAAVRQFEKARALAPKNADVFYGIALSRYELGQSKLAAIAAARAITFDADHPGTTLLLGFISQENGAFQSSRKLYEEYLSYAPESESATELKSVLAQLPRR